MKSEAEVREAFESLSRRYKETKREIEAGQDIFRCLLLASAMPKLEAAVETMAWCLEEKDLGFGQLELLTGGIKTEIQKDRQTRNN